jgi:hypothetical protein
MKHEDIIRLAIEHTIHGLKFDEEGLVRFANLVAQHEREACAKVAQDESDWNGDVAHIADLIRARGQA